MDFTNKLVIFDNRNRKVIAVVSIHDKDTNILTIHNAVFSSNLQPINFKWGGITIHKDKVQLLNL